MECQRCADTGYVPFLRPDGTISQYARMVCPTCGGYDHERSYADGRQPDRQPDDFDFPCSDTWRGYYNGERTSHAVTATSQASRETLDDRRWESVKQLRAELLFLRKKVTEKRIEKKQSNDNYEPF